MTIPVFKGDLFDLLKSAFAAGLDKSQSQLEGDELKRWTRYAKRPVPISTFQRVDNALDRMIVTDEMVERAAKALEKKQKQDTYEWTDEQFEIWWNKDPYFVEKINGWGWFRGTLKEKCLYEARITIEAALS